MHTILALFAVLAGGFVSTTQAEDIIFPPKDFRAGYTRTTLIDILRVPDLKRKDLPATIDITITVWEQGYFTDSAGRSWILFRGPAITTKPERLTGWLLTSVYRQEFFYTTTGSLFRLGDPHEILVLAGCKRPVLKDLKDKPLLKDPKDKSELKDKEKIEGK
jgi:hypothetical protein